MKSGRRRVTIKALKQKYGKGKRVIVRETLRKPSLLQRYRSDKRKKTVPPLSHSELAELEGTAPPDWGELLSAVRSLAVGRENADLYVSAIEKLLTALFYPSLAHPQVEMNIHEGRKRIDITYTNVATDGFFSWLGAHYAAPHVFVECKNYGGEVANPELDQLAGRFSPSRGQFGILVCRSFDKKSRFNKRCKDTANDGRGYILALDDDDVEELCGFRRVENQRAMFAFLKERFDRLIM